MSCNALALWLESTWQSWGYQLSKCEHRSTLSHPTQSGVVGLLGAALGVERGDREGVAKLAALQQEVLVFGHPVREIDYHTVGGGHEGVDGNPRAIVPKNGEPWHTVVTTREYLTGSCFGVILTGDPVLLVRVEAALNDPKWGGWLGRKCCIPTEPINRGLHADSEAAFKHLQEVAADRKKELVRRISPVATFKEGTDTLHDVPLDFEAREFSVRRVRVTDVL